MKPETANPAIEIRMNGNEDWINNEKIIKPRLHRATSIKGFLISDLRAVVMYMN